MVHTEADTGKTRSSCRYPVRCAVAAVMTVLIVAITLNTVKLILYQRSHQHDPALSLSVARGLVYVKRAAAAATHPPALLFYLGVRISNARGNDGFRYYAADMTACLFVKNTPAAEAPDRDAVCCFHQGAFIKAVEQQARHYFLMEAKGTRGGTMNSSHFDNLYRKGGSLDGVVLRLEGTFVAERSSRWNYTTSRDINYCGPLSISGLEADEDELLDHNYDLPCTTVKVGNKGL
ncbi:unnamed protein product [Urochloa decumbens]|uniref:Uncharacterized protein n=1 Tax=Urochloa decumbens TaxID=240449 RepID=A0ABC9DAA5_9POAL